MSEEGDDPSSIAPDSSSDREEEAECSDDDEDGWINPENFNDACVEMGGALQEPAVGVAVGCVTTDFAMQVCTMQVCIYSAISKHTYLQCFTGLPVVEGGGLSPSCWPVT